MAWPDFFIVGAPKAGTTTLYETLGKHDGVFLPDIKEPNYFFPFKGDISPQAVTDTKRYLALFEGADVSQKKGEASPRYLNHPAIPDLIHKCNPDARIIAIIRDPIKRAYSEYLMLQRKGQETLEFSQVIDKCLTQDKHLLGTREYRHYLDEGYYVPALERYIRLFGRECVLLLTFDRLVEDPDGLMNQIYEFLELEIQSAVSVSKSNPYKAPRGMISKMLLYSKWTRHIGRHLVPIKMRRWIRESLLLTEQKKPSMNIEDMDRLKKLYEQDWHMVKEKYGLDLRELGAGK